MSNEKPTPNDLTAYLLDMTAQTAALGDSEAARSLAAALAALAEPVETDPDD